MSMIWCRVLLVVCPVLVLALSGAPARAAAALKPTNLRCEYKTDPLGIAVAQPRLSWVPQATDPAARGLKQAAYEILVASSREKLDRDEADLWKSGKVDSDETIHIPYAGQKLASNRDAYWKVRIWAAGEDDPSAWSGVARWSSGLLDKSDWKAKWIGYDEPAEEVAATQESSDPLNLKNLHWVWTNEGDATKSVPKGTRYFARKVNLPAAVRKATFLGCCDDSFALAVNDKKVGVGGGHTRAYEMNVGPFLHAGDNVLRIEATNGGDNPAALIGRFVIWMENVAEPRIVDVDKSWKFSVQKPAKWDEGQADFAAMKSAVEVVAVGQQPWGTPARRTLVLPPPPYLRKPFALVKPVKRAMVFATARGLYELHLNGQRVGEDVLAPGWTDYHKRIHYLTYDVTQQLQKQRDNVIGAILGDGWHSGYFSYQGKRNLYGSEPRLLVQLEIEYADGSHETIGTDESWRCAYGPYREGDLLQGSAYDARKEIPGWSAPGFDDSSWKSPVRGPTTRAALEPHPGDPVRRHEEIPAKKISEPVPGTYVFDLGQNMVGWVRLKVKDQPEGRKITLHHAEMLEPNGTLYLTALRQARAMDTYVCKGGGGEEGFEPKFTFHGFRYVAVEGLKGKPSLDTVTGIVVGSDIPRTGTFECSDERVNQLFHNIIWGQKGNYLEVPTDCPQRDERLGWTGDAQFFIRTGAYNFDVASFFTKWLVDLDTDAQFPDGSFADVAPDLLGGHGNVAWGDAGVVCPYVIYKTYGDTRLIEQHWPEMVRYLDFLTKSSKDNLRGVGAYGDWLNLDDKTKPEVIGTAYYKYIAQLMSEMALAIGKSDDALKYRKLAEDIRAAFIRNFVSDDGSIKESGQTGYALAFTMDLLPADKRAAAAKQFAQAIQRKNNHLATGFIGTPRLLPGLSLAGKTDLAYQLLLTDTFPSWLFQVKNGATTMWERWDGWTPDKGFQDPGMNSFNHYAFGSVGEWMYRTVGGIDTDGPGFKNIILKPQPGPGLTSAKTTYDSIRGPIATEWKKDGDALTVKFTVPPNTAATAYLPTANAADITESGKPARDAAGVKFLWSENGQSVYRLASGTYEFAVKK